MMLPVNVLYVHHGSGQGGAANSLLYLLQNLDRNRYNPQVCCNVGLPGTEKFFTQHGFPPKHLPIAPFAHTMKTWDWTTPRGTAKLLRWTLVTQARARQAFRHLMIDVEPDIVHLNGLSLLPMAPTASALGIPVVQHVRESVNEGVFGVRKAWLRRLARQNADHIVYICEDNQERLTGETEHSSVIYNPVDFAKFAPVDGAEVRNELRISSNSPVLFFPGGSFFDIKGVDPFLRALAIVHDRFPQTVALMPGIDEPGHPRDPVRRGIEELIGRHKLQDAVKRVPFTSRVEKYYAASDIVVAPFVHPHFSRAVIEAGAMEKPVIGSRIGGITEVLEDGVVGMLATPGDHEELAAKICYLIEHREEAAGMARAGRELSLQRYGADTHAHAVMGVYDRVLYRAGHSQ